MPLNVHYIRSRRDSAGFLPIMLDLHSNGITTTMLLEKATTADGDVILSGTMACKIPSVGEAKWNAIRSFNRWPWVVVIEPDPRLGQNPITLRLWRPRRLIVDINRAYWLQLIIWRAI